MLPFREHIKVIVFSIFGICYCSHRFGLFKALPILLMECTEDMTNLSGANGFIVGWIIRVFGLSVHRSFQILYFTDLVSFYFIYNIAISLNEVVEALIRVRVSQCPSIMFQDLAVSIFRTV